LLAHGQWFSPGTPASSTTTTGRNDIAEKSIRFSTDSNSSSVSCKTEVIHKTPEKNGAVVRFKENLPKPIQTRKICSYFFSMIFRKYIVKM
jgi:hypothetical protein